MPDPVRCIEVCSLSGARFRASELQRSHSFPYSVESLSATDVRNDRGSTKIMPKPCISTVCSGLGQVSARIRDRRALDHAEFVLAESLLYSMARSWNVIAPTNESEMLIVAGAFGGASGAIPSYIKCGEMSRSAFRVPLGGFDNEGGSASATEPRPRLTFPRTRS